MPITTNVPRMKVVYVNILRIFNYLHIVFSVNTIIAEYNTKRETNEKKDGKRQRNKQTVGGRESK
jgi:hypothetical protein